jgi:hypothetical protein
MIEDKFGALLWTGLQQQMGRIDIDPVNVGQVRLQYRRIGFGHDSVLRSM